MTDTDILRKEALTRAVLDNPYEVTCLWERIRVLSKNDRKKLAMTIFYEDGNLETKVTEVIGENGKVKTLAGWKLKEEPIGLTLEEKERLESAYRAGFDTGRYMGETYGGEYTEEDRAEAERMIREGFAEWLKGENYDA